MDITVPLSHLPRLDSIVFNNYIDLDNPITKRAFVYDNLNNITKIERGNIIDNGTTIEFIVTAYDTFIYNSDGIIEEILYANTNTGTLSIYARNKIAYNVNGVADVFISQKWENEEWVNLYKSESIYEGDYLVESKTFFWFPIFESWNIVSSADYIYTMDSKLLEEEIHASYDVNTAEKKLNYKLTNTYDLNDYLDQSHRSNYDDILEMYIPSGKTIYVNDDFGNRIESTSISIDELGEETVSSRIIMTFDTNVERSGIKTGVGTALGLPNKHIILTFEQDHWVMMNGFRFQIGHITILE